ncbi:tetratricopeptide repeat protein [Streptomyces anulatus]
MAEKRDALVVALMRATDGEPWWRTRVTHGGEDVLGDYLNRVHQWQRQNRPPYRRVRVRERIESSLNAMARATPAQVVALTELLRPYFPEERKAGATASATTDNAVSGGVFHAPQIQAGSVSGGVHTYYAQPPHSSLPPVSEWPRLDEVDPIVLGVRRTRRLPGESPLPPYVERDCDRELNARVREAALTGGLVMVTGAPLSGRTRTAWVALSAHLSGTTRVFAPPPGTDLRGLPAVLRGRDEEGCVLWLDDLEGYLGERGLTPTLLADLVRLRVPVLATMDDKAYDARRFGSSGRAGVLSGTEPVELPSVWSAGELECLNTFDGDSRLRAAAVWRGVHTVPQYLAIGPELMEEWRRARRPDAHPRGHLLVRVAIDLARCGASQLSKHALRKGQELYPEESARAEAESFEDGLAWAVDIRHGVTGLLTLVPGEHPAAWVAFGSLVADAEGRPDTPPVSIAMWRFAFILAHDQTERWTVRWRAHEALVPLADSDPVISVLLGYINAVMGDFESAMNWYRKAADAGHAGAAVTVGEMLAAGDEAAQAIPYLRAGAEAGVVHAQYRLGRVLAGQAESWLARAAEAGHPAATQELPALRAVTRRPDQLFPSMVMREEDFLPPDAVPPADPDALSGRHPR